MCFIVKGKRAKVATKNIVCYKVSCHPKRSKVEKYFRPYFQTSFRYFLNKKTSNCSLEVIGDVDDDYINEGYHSYQDLKGNWLMWKRAEFKLGKFIIPKGTKYYENKTEYVSETLIFKGYIK